MPTEVTSALIGVAGTIIGALGGAFRDDIRSFLKRSEAPNKDLLGLWTATWTIERPRGRPDIKDAITVKRVLGERLEGEGIFPELGPYRVQGRLTQSNLVTLTYEGIGEKRSLGGVIILQLNASRTEMEGHWIECNEDRSFLRGSVRLTKAHNRPH